MRNKIGAAGAFIHHSNIHHSFDIRHSSFSSFLCGLCGQFTTRDIRAKLMAPAITGEATHPKSILNNVPRFMVLALFEMPIPSPAPRIACEVEPGTPTKEKKCTVI